MVRKSRIFFLLFFLAYATPAQALSFTVTDNILDGHYLSDGTSLNSLFFVSTFLPDDPYTINSAYYEFNFSDQAEETVYIGTVDNSVGHLHSLDVVYTDSEREQATISIGSQTITEESTDSYERTGVRNYSEYHSGSLPWDSGHSHNHTEYLVEQGYLDFPTTISGFLDSQDLLDLESNGLVFWTLDMLDGDLILDSATLTIDYDLTSSGGATPVPEPSTFLLLGSGLIGLGFFRRKSAIA